MSKIKKIIFTIVTILLLFAVFGCKKEPTLAELNAIELEKKVKENPDDLELVKELMTLYFFDIDDFDRVIELFEERKTAFEKDLDALVVYGAAMAAKAGVSKKVEDQVMWVRKGMLQLDTLVEDYPDESLVYIWRAVTYSNFPKMMDARSIVQEDIDFCFNKIKSGDWTFSPGELRFLYTAMLNIGVTYEDKPYLEEAYNNLQKDISDKELPVFAEYESALKKLK